MRKIPCHYENFFDNIILKYADKCVPFCVKLGITPNMITTLSLFIAVISLYFFVNKYYLLSALSFLLAYFFDCLDGHYARSTDRCTKFGDYYDHVSDTCKVLFLMIAFYIVDKNKFKRILPAFIALDLLMLYHLHCQEILYDNYTPNSSFNFTNNMFKFVCKENVHSHICYSRWVGCGTFILFMTMCILYYYKV